ncbi:WW domain-containing transcription regulator protein 1 [Cuculus canorus]|uniref:WW domain-containing transcription regulator protein 1 n=1 Tax=Cuculus canorus TaxID=55661 RepID=A0A091GIM1_CUCCA|nr:WW domain-containing transcription regulator protein 1 [Cuculus canorus]
MNPPAAPPPGQQVIHVTQDLDTELEALFNAVMNPKPSSWRKKILPDWLQKTIDYTLPSGKSSTWSSSPTTHACIVWIRAQQLKNSAQGRSSDPEEHGHGHVGSRQPDRKALTKASVCVKLVFYLFFLSHIEKITTWQDPRKTMNPLLNHMSHHPAATSTPVPQRSMAMSQPNLVMNHQHQIAASPAMSQQSRPPQTPQAGLLNLPGALTAQQQQQQKLRLQRIQMERERIRMRQEELLRQEAALCRQLPMDSESMAPVQTAVNTPAMTQDMRPIANNGSDPFLNRQVHVFFVRQLILGPYHSREQSTDSGLGLGCYSIPTTPEDFLSNVDEMDTGETIAQTTMNINPQQTRFPDFLDCLPGTNVDLGTLESEDLIPILNDVESVLNKNEPFLTWL